LQSDFLFLYHCVSENDLTCKQKNLDKTETLSLEPQFAEFLSLLLLLNIEDRHWSGYY